MGGYTAIYLTSGIEVGRDSRGPDHLDSSEAFSLWLSIEMENERLSAAEALDLLRCLNESAGRFVLQNLSDDDQIRRVAYDMASFSRLWSLLRTEAFKEEIEASMDELREALT